MNVKLISITKPYIENDNVGMLSVEELIVYIARVSNPNNQSNKETADKLISYLMKNKHWSPFEMVDLTFEIKTSRAIAQQILRHRSFSFQEFSQRYAEVTAFEPIQFRLQAEKNRQSSTESLNLEDIQLGLDTEDGDWGCNDNMQELVDMTLNDCKLVYDLLIKKGVAKECARMILPLTTQTTIYMKGSVRSWIHYLQIRCDEHTQLEHREIALKIRELFNHLFPNIGKGLEWVNE